MPKENGQARRLAKELLAHFDLNLHDYETLMEARSRGVVSWNEPTRARLAARHWLDYRSGSRGHWQLSDFGEKMLTIIDRWLNDELAARNLPSLEIVLDKVVR